MSCGHEAGASGLCSFAALFLKFSEKKESIFFVLSCSVKVKMSIMKRGHSYDFRNTHCCWELYINLKPVYTG